VGVGVGSGVVGVGVGVGGEGVGVGLGGRELGGGVLVISGAGADGGGMGNCTEVAGELADATASAIASYIPCRGKLAGSATNVPTRGPDGS
jgi:hypothetical protein